VKYMIYYSSMAERVWGFRRKLFLSFFLISFAGGLPVYAQNRVREAQDFWLCPGAEAAMYSISNFAYGPSLSLGYGNRISIGFNGAFFFDGAKEVNTLELNLLFRWYILQPVSGLFLQLNGGPAFFFEDKEIFDSDSQLGVFSISLCLGWRFLLGKRFFMEACIRGGYPFIAGAGISAGLHF